jgi:hypothetical protein
MIINSYTTKAELAEFFELSIVESGYLKNILIDECRSNTEDISKEDMAQSIETAKRFAEENE